MSRGLYETRRISVHVECLFHVLCNCILMLFFICDGVSFFYVCLNV